jgi:hypothetical protein
VGREDELVQDPETPRLSSHPSARVDLAAKGAKPTEPRAVRNLRVAFVDRPGGVRIEMVKGRKDEELVGH